MIYIKLNNNEVAVICQKNKTKWQIQQSTKPTTIFWIIITSFFRSRGFNKLNKLVYGNLNVAPEALYFARLLKDYYKPRTDVLPVFTDELLQRINAHTLFIGGENDCFYHSQKAATRLNRNLKNVQWHVLEDSGHVLINQTGIIVNFLKS